VEDEIIKLHKNYCEKTLFDSNPKWLEPIECVVLGGEGGKTNGFRQYPLNGFINKLLTDDEFYEKWGNDCCKEITTKEMCEMFGVDYDKVTEWTYHGKNINRDLEVRSMLTDPDVGPNYPQRKLKEN
jgi:hypothetical protein